MNPRFFDFLTGFFSGNRTIRFLRRIKGGCYIRVKVAKKAKTKTPVQYTVRVVFTGTEEESRRVLAEARRYAFARVLEKIRREKGEPLC
jgi:hypothetical protein